MSVEKTFNQIGFIEQTIKLGYRQTRRQFDRSKIGIFWIPLHYLLHVLLIGLVFRYVWQDEGFLLFFSYSYLSWRLLTDPIVEGAHFWRSSHSYVWYIGVRPVVLVGAWFMANLIKTFLWLVPTLIFTTVFLGSFPANFFGFIFTLLMVRVTGSFVGYIFSFISARFWEVSETINSIILLAYLLSPVFWRPDRLGENNLWLAEINPIYYFMELPRNFALGEPAKLKVIAIAMGLTMVTVIIAYFFHKKFSKKVVMWVS